MAICRESQKRYFSVAREVRDIDLKYLFSSYALQRGKFVAELEIWVTAEGGLGLDGSESGSRDNEEVEKNFPGGREDREILWECLAKENEVLEAYREAEEADGPGELRAILAAQVRDVTAARSRLRELQALLEDAG